MLSSILLKSDCAACKFCCSFRRQSLWETPVFYEEDISKIKKLFPEVRFRELKAEADNSNAVDTGISKSKVYTFDIYDKYKTNSSEEEVPCPFLDTEKGCKLPQELKPFDCKIWPLRVVKIPQNKMPAKFSEALSTKIENPAAALSRLVVVLTPTCPAINKIPFEKVQALTEGGLGKTILEYAATHPQMIKEYSEFLSKIVYKQ